MNPHYYYRGFFMAVLLLLGLNVFAQLAEIGSPRNVQPNGAVMTTYSGKVIPVIVTPGADITMVPIKAELKSVHIGWYQMGLSVYPVYEGSKGGWYTLRTSRTGSVYKYYIPIELRSKVTLE